MFGNVRERSVLVFVCTLPPRPALFVGYSANIQRYAAGAIVGQPGQTGHLIGTECPGGRRTSGREEHGGEGNFFRGRTVHNDICFVFCVLHPQKEKRLVFFYLLQK